MKIAHISDIHWRGLQRHEEYVDAFNQLFDQLKTIKPDIILCTGDIWHTKTQGITPEAIDKMTWMFKGLAEIAPLHIMLGNHDGNLANDARQDAISPIIEAIKSPRIFLYKKSGNYVLNEQIPVMHFCGGSEYEESFATRPFANFCVFSCFDKEGWSKVKPTSNLVNIALYHGSITGCQTDSEWTMPHGEEALGFFDGYDFAMLGDIHKMQFLAERGHDGLTRDLKPWIGYPGSMIQQNYGEDEEKGFLIWNIRSKNDWDVTFHPLVNKTPYLSIPWMGSVKETIEVVEEIRQEHAFTKGSRIRVLSNQNISQLECRQLHHEIKEKRECSELVFKIDASKTSIQAIQTGTVTAHKTSLRNDLATLVALYEEYVQAHLLKLNLTPDQLRQGGDFIKGYLHKLKEQDTDETTRDVEWVVKDIEFSNLFRFGENNKISFEKLSGIVGVFGPNRSGKSSVVSALSYGLFNTTEREVGRAVGHYINRNKKNAKCKVRFAANGVNYVVDRTILLKEPKKGEEATMATTTNLLLYRVDEKGGLIPMGNENDISRPDTDKVIRGLIGNPMDFRLTSYSSQGDINRFIDQGATQRKSILNRFLDLDIFEKLFKFANDDRTMLNSKTARFSPIASETAINQADADLEKKEKELTSTQATIIAVNKQISTLREWLLSNASSTNAASELQARKAKITQEVQNLRVKKQDLTTKKSNLQDKLLAVLQEESKLLMNKSNYNIDSLLEVQKSLHEFQQEARTIASSLDKETTLLETQKKSVKKLETVPCGNMFPGCRFIKDSHDDKIRLPVQQGNVDKLTQEATQMNQQIRDLATQGVDDKIKAYNLLIKTEADLEKKRLVLEADLNVVKVQLTSVEEYLEEKEEELTSPEFNVQEEDLGEVKETQRLLVEKEKSLFTAETQKNKLLMEIGNLQGRLEQLMVEKVQCTAILAQLQVLDSVVEAFSKNGIPAMVLKTQLPAINDELAKILSNVVDFRVSLETEVTSNSLDVYIEDGGSKRIIELASGMEKFVASLALRVALINLSSLPRTNMFIVDEGFGVLDEESIVKCLQLLTSLKNYFKLILVISHISQVKEIADKMVEVVNLGSESRIEV